MEKFLTELYSYENFGLYLIIAIIVLVILFIMILFFGKKDKKERELEETRRLEKLNPELFKKDESTTDNTVPEVNEVKQEEPVTEIPVTPVLEEVVPLVNNVTSNEETIAPSVPMMDSIQPKEEETPVVAESPVVEPIIPEPIPVVTIPEPEIKPVLEKEEEKPLVLNDENNEVEEDSKLNSIVDIPEFNFEEVTAKANEILKEETELPELKVSEEQTIPEMPTPEKVEQNVPVFSSVYVPKNEETNDSDDDDLEFELPKRKSEVKKEEAVNPVTVEEKEEDVLKEVEPFNNVDIDNIMGESYTINK